ncbi:hypothetical protein EMCRGX_G033124 [Ephydatia muelleri]
MVDAKQLLQKSWFDSAWTPILNQNNVMDYFCQRSNPFYERTCNNEIIRMQRGDPAQLVNMIGTEYSLLHVQDPILYVIRKAHRQSTDKVTPLADYYILGGVVYQCPDLATVINARLLSTLHLVHSAFSEAISYARYDPTKGYYWEFPDDEPEKRGTATITEEPNEIQRKRSDLLLAELTKKFPMKAYTSKEMGKPLIISEEVKADVKVEVKTEKEVKVVKPLTEDREQPASAKRPIQPPLDTKTVTDFKRKRT